MGPNNGLEARQELLSLLKPHPECLQSINCLILFRCVVQVWPVDNVYPVQGSGAVAAPGPSAVLLWGEILRLISPLRRYLRFELFLYRLSADSSPG